MNNLFLNRYPYTDFHELNLSWLIQVITEVQTTLEQFVSINALKYADPIQWNITTQYEKNTIVIDPVSGVAYISVQPVPSGVALTNTDYWTVVFDLGQFVVRASKNFSVHYENDTTTSATFSSTAGAWLVWGDTLYKALVNITPGDTYVVGGNIEHFTMEELVGHLDDLTTTDKTSIVNAINEVFSLVSSLSNNVGDLNNLQTTDTSSIVNAINEVFTLVTNTSSDLITLSTHVGDIANLTTPDTSSIVNAVNSIMTEIHDKFVFVTDFGADPTGVNDSSQAFNDAIALLGSEGGCIIVPAGQYKLLSAVDVDEGCILFKGDSENSSKINIAFNGYAFNVTKDWCGFENLSFYGVSQTSGGAIYVDCPNGIYADHCIFKSTYNGIHINNTNCVHNFITNICMFDLVNFGIYVELASGLSYLDNLEIYRCKVGIYIINGWDLWFMSNIEVFGSTVHGIMVQPTIATCDLFMTNVVADSSTQCGMFFNGNNGISLSRIFLNNCWASGNDTYGIQIRSVRGAVLSECYVIANDYDGIYVMSGAKHIDINNCYCCANSQRTSNTWSGIKIDQDAEWVRVNGGMFGAELFELFPGDVNNTNPADYSIAPNTQKYGIDIHANTVDNVDIINANVSTNLTAGLYNGSTSGNNKITNVKGYNPVGALTVTIPVSGGSVTNTFAVDCMVYCKDFTNVVLDGTDLGEATSVYVPAGHTLGVVYSATPTWYWIGL